MNRDAAEVIGRNIGIAGSVAGVSGAVGTAIAKSSLPPLGSTKSWTCSWCSNCWRGYTCWNFSN